MGGSGCSHEEGDDGCWVGCDGVDEWVELVDFVEVALFGFVVGPLEYEVGGFVFGFLCVLGGVVVEEVGDLFWCVILSSEEGVGAFGVVAEWWFDG